MPIVRLLDDIHDDLADVPVYGIEESAVVQGEETPSIPLVMEAGRDLWGPGTDLEDRSAVVKRARNRILAELEQFRAHIPLVSRI